MPGVYTLRKTYVDGDVLSASDYVADHQQHIDNQDPQHTGDYSSDLTQMRTKTNPGDVGSESLATTLAGEIERLRYEINAVKTLLNGSAVAQWYSKSWTATPSNGTVTTAKVANGASIIQYIQLAFSNQATSLVEAIMVSQAMTVTRGWVHIRAFMTNVTIGNARVGLKMRLYRDGVLLREYISQGMAAAPGVEQYAVAAIDHLDNPGAATVTYQIRAVQVNANTSFTVNDGYIALEEAL